MSAKGRKKDAEQKPEGPDVDELIIQALAIGRSQDEAGKAGGISGRQVRRKLEDAAFRRRIAEARGAMLEQASAATLGMMVHASATLYGLLKSANDQVKLGAARAIMQAGLSLRAAAEIEGRLLALEEAAGKTDHDRLDKWRDDYKGPQDEA